MCARVVYQSMFSVIAVFTMRDSFSETLLSCLGKELLSFHDCRVNTGGVRISLLKKLGVVKVR